MSEPSRRGDDGASSDPGTPHAQGVADDAILDELLGKLVRDVSEGRAIDLAGALPDRPDLRHRVREVFETAMDIAIRRPTKRTRIGGYDVLGRLGRAGMGAVYLAHHEKLGRTVALKTLPPRWITEPEAAERFRREIRAIALLKHPLIVPIFDVGEEAGTPFFTMELVEGRTLAEVIESLRKLECPPAKLSVEHLARTALVSGPEAPKDWGRTYERAVCRLVLDVADALSHTHGQGVIHRDVKPSNVMVRWDGRALLFDFGLARLESESTVTEAGEFVGTLAYASTEQLSPESDALDGRTDVYSLGVTLYELLTLALPFRGSTMNQTIERIRSDPAPSPRRLNARIPRDLETICLRAIEKQPCRRYSSAAAFARDLRAFLDYRPIVARPASVTHRLWQSARRRPARATLVAALIVGVPSIAGLFGYIAAKQSDISAGREQRRIAEVEQALEEGFLDLAERRIATATGAFERALAFEPESAEAIAGIALAFLRQHQPVDAVSYLERRAGPSTRQPSLGRLRAYALRLAGREEDALEVERPLSESTTSLDVFIEGLIEIERGHQGESEAYARAVERLSRAIFHPGQDRTLLYFELAHAVGHAKDRVVGETCAAALQTSWPTSARAWIASGFCLHAVDEDRAIQAYRHALSLDPNHAVAHNNLGVLLRNSGDAAGAMAEFRRALEAGPEYPDAHHNIGHELEKAGDVTGAIVEYRRAIEISPTFASPHFRLGYVLNNLGEFAAAIPEHRRAIELEPTNAQASNNLGFALRKTGDLPGAIAAYRRAVELDPTLAGAHYNLGNALDAARDYAGAIAAHRRALEIDPNNADVRLNLALATRRAGDLVVAIAEFRRAADLRPDSAVIHHELGRALAVSKLHAEAIVEYRRAVELEPNRPLLHGNLGWSLLNVKDYAGAAAEIRTALRIDPETALLHDYLGLALRGLGDEQAAIAEFRAALRIDPKDAGTHADLARSLDALGNVEAAIEEYQRALEIDPKHAVAHRGLVSAYRATGNVPPARRELERWTDLFPNDATAWNRLAFFLVDPKSSLEARDPKAALDAARRAVELSKGSDASILDTLAEAQHAAGDSAGAIATEERALDVLARSNGSSPELRAALERSLARFREAAPK